MKPSPQKLPPAPPTRPSRSHRRGQALIEFILTLPLLIVVILGMIQLFIMMDNRQKCRSHTWFAMRGQCFDFRTRNVKEADMQALLQAQVFRSGDTVSVSHEIIANPFMIVVSVLSPLNPAKEVKSTVSCTSPYLYRNLPWMKNLFSHVVTADGIKVEASASTPGMAYNAASDRSLND